MPAIERFGPTRRGGPLFRWLGEPLAIDLANTVMVVAGEIDDGTSGPGKENEAVDLLVEPAELRHWLAAESDRLAGFEVDVDDDLDAIRALREVVREMFAAAAEGEELAPSAVEALNEASAASPAAPQLALPTGRGSATGGSLALAPPLALDRSATGLLAAVARSAIELLAATPEGELRICRAPSCGMFYLGARRWCCSACGNRARAARHYRRHRAASAGHAPRRGATQ